MTRTTWERTIRVGRWSLTLRLVRQARRDRLTLYHGVIGEK